MVLMFLFFFLICFYYLFYVVVLFYVDFCIFYVHLFQISFVHFMYKSFFISSFFIDNTGWKWERKENLAKTLLQVCVCKSIVKLLFVFFLLLLLFIRKVSKEIKCFQETVKILSLTEGKIIEQKKQEQWPECKETNMEAKAVLEWI